MSMTESQDLETATTAIEETAPDQKTRRYDRQLRLWATSGQAALESARLLVISASATSTSTLKNLVLPGIGHFTILDAGKTRPEDAGNNFFLEHSSIGKSRAQEAVRLLCELNEGVEGIADTRELSDVLTSDPSFITSFHLVIAHNIEPALLSKLSCLLWTDPTHPSLMVVLSSGLIAEFYIQFHEHTIIESHTEAPPESLRLDKPFPALLEAAIALDLEGMDETTHLHIPYVLILVRAMHDWKAAHGGSPPSTYAEKKAFREAVGRMARSGDAENFEEAVAQAYRATLTSKIPSDIAALFASPPRDDPAFTTLLKALEAFTKEEPYTLPLSAVLPDMKSDTTQYVGLQTLYKAQAREEQARLTAHLPVDANVPPEMLDSFVRNAHGIKVLRGKQWASLDSDKDALTTALQTAEKQTLTHLGLSALSTLLLQGNHAPTAEQLREIVDGVVPPGTTLQDEDTLDNALGEIARAPLADVPTVSAMLGGLVAQEAIKMITKQYVPQVGYTVIDLVDTTTGIVPQ